ncbi:hypothetical protein, partial [Aliiroseovarius sp.]|uniref:hypothetical protein n=1 Tax=Aliiroseovarius sp. TaxID=1872442 RepID=UPI00262FC89E
MGYTLADCPVSWDHFSGRTIHSGPFKQRETLELCIQEAARVCLPLAAMLVDYSNREIEDGGK